MHERARTRHNTARSWLSVLETSFLIFKLPPWIRNPRKRVIKAPKMHFVDTGLACALLGIRSPEQLRTHPLRGALFESWVASEVLKARLHRRLPADLFHLRETRGVEIDLVVEATDSIIGVEVKSGATIASDFLHGLRELPDIVARVADGRSPVGRLVYGGDEAQSRSDGEVVPWVGVQEMDWA